MPALPLTLATWLLAGSFPRTHDLINDWHSHAIYFAMFLYGYWLGTDPDLWAELRRLRWWLAGAAVVTATAFLWLSFATRPEPSVVRALFDPVQRLNAWTWILAVLAWGHHLLNRPFRWLPYAGQAVYPWYVLHQTITVIAGYWLAKAALGPVIEPLLVVLATIAGCLLIHEFAIRRSRVLGPLFGLGSDRGAARRVGQPPAPRDTLPAPPAAFAAVGRSYKGSTPRDGAASREP